MVKFSRIKDINIEDSNSWNNHIFLTFDTDWALDPVLEYTLDLIDEFNLSATIFVTHDTPLLDRIRLNSRIELGIHPNFNYLLEGDFRYGKNYEEVIRYYKKIVPEAISLRSHSLVNSSRISGILDDLGIHFNCNYFLPDNSVEAIRPFTYWSSKLVIVPYIWEDDISLLYNDHRPIHKVVKTKSLTVLDFHPIHIFLNSDSMERYSNSKQDSNDFAKLTSYVNKERPGIRDKFLDMMEYYNKK